MHTTSFIMRRFYVVLVALPYELGVLQHARLSVREPSSDKKSDMLLPSKLIWKRYGNPCHRLVANLVLYAIGLII